MFQLLLGFPESGYNENKNGESMYTLSKKFFIGLIFSYVFLMQSSLVQAKKEGVDYYYSNHSGKQTVELSAPSADGTEIVCQKIKGADPVCYHIDKSRRLTITEPTHWERLKKLFYYEQEKAEKEFNELKRNFNLVKHKIESDF